MNIAMRKLPNFFEEGEIAIVESGEQTGMLQKAFLSIANDLRGQDELRSKVINAMTYPFIIMFFLVLALTVVMVYVIPQLMPIIGAMSGELPFTTRSLIWISTFMKENIILMVSTAVALGLIWVGYTRTEHGKYFADREKFTLPLV